MTKLGISIEPAKVRLITRASDPYTWQALPEKQHLVRKHLSKHSIDTYRELYRGVGILLKASLVNESSKVAEGRLLEENPGATLYAFYISWPPTNNIQNASSIDITFTTVIEKLETEKRKLTAELQELQVQAAKAIKSKELAEDEATRLISLIQAADVEKQSLTSAQFDRHGGIPQKHNGQFGG